jgi:hypothetical protein
VKGFCLAICDSFAKPGIERNRQSVIKGNGKRTSVNSNEVELMKWL